MQRAWSEVPTEELREIIARANSGVPNSIYDTLKFDWEALENLKGATAELQRRLL